jgi:hypothetical protein
VVDEDESHRPGGGCTQVCLVPPGRSAFACETKIHFVYEGCRLEGVIPALISQ